MLNIYFIFGKPILAFGTAKGIPQEWKAVSKHTVMSSPEASKKTIRNGKTTHDSAITICYTPSCVRMELPSASNQ